MGVDKDLADIDSPSRCGVSFNFNHCQKLLARMTMVRQRALHLGSDCTGLGTDALAARELGLNFKVIFGS